MELDQLTLFAADSPAKTFPPAGRAKASTERDQAFSTKSYDYLASYDQNTSSWKTAQGCLVALAENGRAEFSGPWPRSGMTRNGTLYPQATLERPIGVNASGLLPTPLASDNRNRGDLTMPSIKRRIAIGKQVGLSMLFKGNPCPMCVEGMMGFPARWTALDAMETLWSLT